MTVSFLQGSKFGAWVIEMALIKGGFACLAEIRCLKALDVKVHPRGSA